MKVFNIVYDLTYKDTGAIGDCVKSVIANDFKTAFDKLHDFLKKEDENIKKIYVRKMEIVTTEDIIL